MSLAEEEEEELIIALEDSEAGIDVLDHCLIGRFLTDQPINFQAMKTHMATVWRPQKGVIIKEVGEGGYLFQFFHHVDLKRIIDGSPWSFVSHLLIMHHLKKRRTSTESSLIGGSLLGSDYDKSNYAVAWRPYMRIRVAIDVALPLKRRKKLHQPSGDAFTVMFKYERLNSFCFVCGRLGHTEKFREELFKHESVSDIKKEWGSWLKALDKRVSSINTMK
ncbi:hypothetical protein ACS0TY_013161 [Phlomoides rotata]